MGLVRKLKAGRILTVGGFAALTALLTMTGLAAGAANDLTLISRASGADGAVGDSNSTNSSISADGRYIAFQSVANLGTDSGVGSDIFLRDTQTNTTTLVSRDTGVAGAIGDGSSGRPSISADGRYVAFSSDADNIDDDSNDAFTDIFVRDTQANTTTLVSRDTGAAGVGGDNFSRNPSISADGQHVAFQSDADNIDDDSSDTESDVFVRDTEANTTTLVSRDTDAAGVVGDDTSDIPAISGDGSHVAFESDADNLDDDSNDGFRDVFVRDTQANTTTLVSRATGATGAVGNVASVEPSISADGRYVAFSSGASDLDPSVEDSTADDVFVRDTQANSTTHVSRATSGLVGNGGSREPSISADGRHVAFESDADTLDPDSNDSVGDVFVRDTQTNATTLVSRATGAAGVVGNAASNNPSISAEGRYVAFESIAQNIDPVNAAATDIFRRELFDLGGPTVQSPPPGGGALAKKCKKGFKLKKVKTKSGKRKKKCVRVKKKKK